MKSKNKLAVYACLSSIRKIFLSPLFLLSCLGCTAALFVVVVEQLPEVMTTLKGEFFPPETVEKLIKAAICSEAFYFVLPLLSALVQSSTFLRELESGFCRSVLPRCGKHGKHRYLLGKFFSCIISGGAVPTIGYLMFRIILPVIFPVSQANGESTPIFTTCLLLFLFGAFCSLVGMTASVCFRQSYIALLSPFILCFFPVILRERYFEETFVIDPRTWISPDVEKWFCGEYGPAILMGVLIILFGCLFSLFSRRRLSRL